MLLLYALIFNFLFCSCGSFNEPISRENKLNLNATNLNQFDGKYKRLSTTYEDGPNFYCEFNDSFKCFYLWKGKKLMNASVTENDFLELEVIDKTNIKVSFVLNGKIEKSKILKGKLTENTFVFNSRNFLIPLVLINYGERHITRISLSEKGNLNIDAYQFALANFFIFPWTSGQYEVYNLEFEKIRE